MAKRLNRKVVLVVRHTRLAQLMVRYNSIEQAQFYVEHMGMDFSDYIKEDEVFNSSLKKVKEIIGQNGRIQMVERSFLPNFVFQKEDIVVVLGQDGLVANVMKYLDHQPLIGVNPDPNRLEGVLLPTSIIHLKNTLNRLENDEVEEEKITLAELTLNTGETLIAVNDFFIGHKSHMSSLYSISFNEYTENQSSSGIIVSTGLGSTGWFKSVVVGAKGINQYITGEEKVSDEQYKIPWDAPYLMFAVREPWPGNPYSTNLSMGKINKKSPLVITSNMPENGVIFSDGMDWDFLEFQSGTKATIGIADKVGLLIH